MLRSSGSVAWVMAMPQGVTSDEEGSVLSTWQVALAETGLLPLGGGGFLPDVDADLADGSGPKSPTSDGRLYTAVLRLYSGSTFFTPGVPASTLAARVTWEETWQQAAEGRGKDAAVRARRGARARARAAMAARGDPGARERHQRALPPLRAGRCAGYQRAGNQQAGGVPGPRPRRQADCSASRHPARRGPATA
jgi:hypothetical protein